MLLFPICFASAAAQREPSAVFGWLYAASSAPTNSPALALHFCSHFHSANKLTASHRACGLLRAVPMAKIKVKNPVVEMDGDEMTRIIGRRFAKSSFCRTSTSTSSTTTSDRIPRQDRRQGDLRKRRSHQKVRRRGEVPDHHARRSPREGIQPQADVPFAQRHDPEHPQRHHFPRPIVARTCRGSCKHWDKPVVVARHGFGDQYKASEILFPGAGTVKLTYTPADGGPPIEKKCSRRSGGGVTLAMYNLDDSIKGFARACFNYAPGPRLRRVPLDEKHHSESLRRPLQESLPGDVTTRNSSRNLRRRS